jgi:hypothetical protein
MAHTIVTTEARNGTSHTYTHAESGLTADGTDGLARLCRKLGALGYSGPAEIKGEDGRLHYTVRGVERVAKLTLTEGDRSGLKWQTYRPNPMAAARMAGSAGAGATENGFSGEGS